ncbi:hypothetical protein KEM56_005859 [Ascosphaera pollenicola]|nr:hypothetical protein KEM56_005859 [Ascosphaera pollenicola]
MNTPNPPSATVSNPPPDARDNSSRNTRFPHRDRDDGDSADDAWSGQESVDNGKGDNDDRSAASHGLKRKRPQTISCELCKQRKVKCDRAQPSCGWCTRNGQICEYKERKKPGLRAGYGKELESRLDRLERIISTQAQLIETHLIDRHNDRDNASAQLHHRSPSSLVSEARSSPRVALRPQDTPNTDTSRRPRAGIASSQASMPMQFNGVNSALHQRVPAGMGSPVALSQLINTPQQPRGDQAHPVRFEGPNPLYSPTECSAPDPDLPPYDLLYNLVDLYFEHVNTWCPILHRRTTLDTFFGPTPLGVEDRMLLYAIVAVTIRFSKDSRLDKKNEKRFHDNAKQKVLLYGLESSSIKALQALVILALDLVGSSNGPPGWKLLAVICRSVVQIGLSVETTSNLAANWYPSIYTLRANVLPEPHTWIEDESRRRLFWEVYILDRYATITTAFDFALNENDIDRKLPCREEFFNKNHMVETQYFVPHPRTDYSGPRENIGSWGFYVEVIGILSRIHLFLKRPVDIGSLTDVEEWQDMYRRLDDELTRWESSLPKEYASDNALRLLMSKANKTVNCGWAMLHATYQTAIIRLHSSAAYPTTRSAIFTPSYSAIQRCLLAVQAIHTLTTFVVDHGILDKVGPTFAFTLWVCARLLLVHGSTVAHTLKPEMYFFVKTLRDMGHYWQVAERYSSILQRVLDEYCDFEQNRDILTAGEQPGTPSAVKILADMRRCAFDLDFLITRQPRATLNAEATRANVPARPSNAMPAMPATRTGGLQDAEYLDLFGFFNYPRLPQYTDSLAQQAAVAAQPVMADAAMSSTPNHQPAQPATNAANGNGNGNGNGRPMDYSKFNSVNNAASTMESVSGNSIPLNNIFPGQEFNITNYLVPTPETDWLFSNER